MYRLLIKQFLRSRIAWLSFILILAMGGISVLIGRQFLAKQEDTIVKVAQQQQEHIQRNVAQQKEMGLLLYYLRFSVVSKPTKLAALSIGQRDINPGIESVTIRTLEGQKYDTDLSNPTQLQSGNLDLGFVIIYLFPLLIIVFMFNLLSEEGESGTWRLVAVQSRSGARFLVQKLIVRAVFIYVALIVLFVFAIVALSLPLDVSLLAFVVLSIVYLAFWFALCFWVVLFKRSSGVNALTLLSVWVVLTILLPASVNNYVTALYPVPESLGTMVKQRDSYHEKWDMDRRQTLDKFYAHYPRFAKYGVPEGEFNWLWYYAMQQMGDDESAEQSKALREKIQQRERASRFIATAVPTLHTQLQFNDLAHTSLTDYTALLDSTAVFHEALRMHFYPRIFENSAVPGEDWASFKPKFLHPAPHTHWARAILPIVLVTALIALAARARAGSLNTY